MNPLAPAPTSLWRLEWLRLVRTHRWLGLGGLFLLLGLASPILTANMQWLLQHADTNGNVTVIAPDPTVADGIASYLSQVAQLGVIVLMVSAAGPLCPYGHRQLAVFYRTLARRDGGWPAATSAAVLLPRFVAASVCAVVVFVLGMLGAWYETAVLIGAPRPGPLAAGTAMCAVYLVFCIAVVAAVAAQAKSTVATAGVSVIAVLVLSIAENIPYLGRAVPTRLAQATTELLRGHSATGYLPAIGASVLLTAGLLWLAAVLAERREF